MLKKMCTIDPDFQKLEQTSEEMLLLGTSEQETLSCISLKLLCPLQQLKTGLYFVDRHMIFRH